ncbi:MAG: AraC family transcriptional regulator [Lachnospiraceae bacterium]|nr:AraC family transcriptional regulator [Lachnospiraceae bacterium]
MKYIIRELDTFSIIGQEIELTKFQRKNIQISTQFWRTFNTNLKKAYLSQYGNWIKYAFMERRNDKLFYYCAIPQKNVIPEGFIAKEIQRHKYLMIEHRGSMDKIYDTYKKLYQEVLKDTEYLPLQNEFLHFERYDYRFKWNNPASIIEIWLPIKD